MKYIPIISTAIALSFSAYAYAGETEYTIEMKNGAFNPPSLEVPAHQKIHLFVKNSEDVQTEFESYELNQAKL